jgi:hypothetical protein
MREARFSFLRHDIVEPVRVEGPLDEVWNLACAASPAAVPARSAAHDADLRQGTWHLLDLAARRARGSSRPRPPRSMGDPEVSLQSESYRGCVNTWGPRACYDEGKRAAETLCFEYGRLGVAVRVARIFNTYGPRMSPEDGRVVSNFVRQALMAEPITLYGDGDADAELLLRGRPRGGARAADALGGGGAGEPRQPGRVHGARAGRDGAGDDGLGLAAGPSPPAAGRPAPAAGPTSPARTELGGSPRWRCGTGSRDIAHSARRFAEALRKEARNGVTRQPRG